MNLYSDITLVDFPCWGCLEEKELNQTLLAQKMEMSKVVFGKKLNDGLFSDDELVRLKMILRELYSDLDDVIDIDFIDMLKSII